VISYNAETVSENTVPSAQHCFELKKADQINWINVDGVHDPHAIELLGKQFNIHPLVLEDILNTDKRPKVEDYGEYLFIIMKMVYPDNSRRGIILEQVSLIVGDGLVLTFQEQGDDVFHDLRERLRTGKGKIRKLGSDYLMYAILDAIIDSYFLVLEEFGEELERLESQVLTATHANIVKQIQSLKRTALTLRRASWPQRELLSTLERSENPVCSDGTRLYLRDVYDHAVEIIDIIENYRETVATQMELHLSTISNRLNSVMVFLAIVSTIFMPLTFIAGVYGMNFEHMPELKHPLGYPATVTGMLLIAVGMLFWFRKKGWM
jgi:magnesium transporter